MPQFNRVLAFFAGLFAILVATAPAYAGDRALLDVLGYSEDGRYFAFEEYGIQDGSGFAYSSIYVIDLDEDRWVVGTPVRVQSEDETEMLSQIRRQVHSEAQDRLEDLQIYRPAQIAALIGDGVPGADGMHLRFAVPVGFITPGSTGSEYDIDLEVFDTTSGSPCLEWADEPPKGFALKITDYGVTREAHRDRTLPRSRGCPTAYRIFGVYLPFETADISRAVALISVYVYGFEGPDRRFIAVPLSYSF